MEGLILQTPSQNSSLSCSPSLSNPLFHLRPLRHEGSSLPTLFFFYLHPISRLLNLRFLQHPNPVGTGLATEAVVEAAGPDCIVPGQITPIRLLGVKVFLVFCLILWSCISLAENSFPLMIISYQNYYYYYYLTDIINFIVVSLVFYFFIFFKQIYISFS